MPELKSKKSGKTWKDAQSFYNDYIQVDPSAKNHSPDDLWEAARTSGGYDFADDAPQPVATQPPPTATPSKPFSPVQMAKNLPRSLAKQGQEMVTGAGEIMRNVSPNAVYDPKSIVGKAVANPGSVSPGSIWNGIIDTINAVKKDYSDFYGGGNFLANLEQDPARVAADAASLIPIIGWGAKAAGLGKTASTLGKTARVLDISSNPVAMASEAVARVPKPLNRVAMNLMESSLSFPKDVKAKVRVAQSKHALQHGITMTEKGADKAKVGYGKAVENLHDIENKATASGLDMDVNRIKSKAMANPPTGGSQFAGKFGDEVTDIIADPMHFGGQPVVSPNQAATVRKNLNKSVQPEYGTIKDQSLSLRKDAEKAVLDATKSELGTIPRQKAAAVKSGKWGAVAERAESVSLAMRGRSVVDTAQPGAMGAAIRQGAGLHLFEPTQIGAVAKLLHTPKHMSRAANKIYSINPRAVSREARKIQSPGIQATSNVLKQAGKPNPNRPFAEDDEPQQVNPLRPFPEE